MLQKETLNQLLNFSIRDGEKIGCKFYITLIHWTDRSSHQGCSMQKGVLRNLTNFTGKHLWQSLFFNKAVGLRPATLLKKRLRYRCFPVSCEFCEISQRTFFTDYLWATTSEIPQWEDFKMSLYTFLWLIILEIRAFKVRKTEKFFS